MSAGQKTQVGDTGVELATELQYPASAVSWQTGRLAFNREPLRYVLEDVNRYAAKPIVLDDASLGDVRITGTVTSSNVPGWIASLENAFAVVAVEMPDRIVLRRE